MAEDMDQLTEEMQQVFDKAKADWDTGRMWDIIAAVAEKAWIKHMQFGGQMHSFKPQMM